MRVLIVDDEPLAREALANTLAARKDVERFDSACDAMEALAKLGEAEYDVLLLDISMPEVSGIELVDRLKENNFPVPSVVFVTAYKEHAIAAFEKHAVDYVLKPFSNDRINEALGAAFRRSSDERAAQLIETLPLLRQLSQHGPTRIAIKANGSIVFIDPSDVQVVRAQGNYVLLEREAGSHLLRESISVMARKLKPYGFVQIHRSVLVNAAFVERVQPRATGEYGLRLKGGRKYTVSRTYKANLNRLASTWIAPEV
jgi:two-component system, LytTR family, response regulator